MLWPRVKVEGKGGPEGAKGPERQGANRAVTPNDGSDRKSCGSDLSKRPYDVVPWAGCEGRAIQRTPLSKSMTPAASQKTVCHDRRLPINPLKLREARIPISKPLITNPTTFPRPGPITRLAA